MSHEDALCRLAEAHGASVNRQGGVYVNGEAYSFTKKLEVAAAYQAARDENDGERPNISQRILRPADIQQNKSHSRGPGSRSLDEYDRAVILFLYLDEHSRPLASYVEWLQHLTGTVVCGQTISNFFRDAFPHRGGLCRPNLVPFDKFRPSNIEKAWDYLGVISRIAPHRIKFGDEKHLKGDEVFSRKVRRNPLTGVVPEMVVTPDFRNRYNMTEFCSVNPETTSRAVWYCINDIINDAEQFSVELEKAIQSGFLRGGDVLVLDNTTVHNGGENSVLQDYLWERHGIFLLFLPARAPEWNPMEQVWKSMVQRLKKLPLNMCRRAGEHFTAHAAISILSGITHAEVFQFYVGSGLIHGT